MVDATLTTLGADLDLAVTYFKKVVVSVSLTDQDKQGKMNSGVSYITQRLAEIVDYVNYTILKTSQSTEISNPPAT